METKRLESTKKLKPRGMQSTIMLAFSVISVSIMLILGIVMYMKFSALSQHEIVQNTAVNIKAIVCYHIRRNHCAYLSHCKTAILRSSL